MVSAATPNESEVQVNATTPFVATDDTFHACPDNDPYWAETTWWSFNIPERKIGGWLHATFNTNRGTVTWRVYVWDPTGALPEDLAYFRMETEVPVDDPAPDLRDIAIPGGGFSVKMLRPLRDYRIEYSDPTADFAIQLSFSGIGDPRRYTPGEPPFMEHAHLDQVGHVTGELVLHGESIPIDCYSVRDRSWAPRGGPAPGPKPATRAEFDRTRHPVGPRWRQIERERGRGRIQYFFGHAGPDAGFLAFVRPSDGDAAGWSPLNHGWLLRDGRFELLDKTASVMKNYRDPVTGWSAQMDVHLTDVTGRTMDAEGFTLSHICERGSGSTALMRWEFDGRIGWGEDQDVWNPTHFARMHDALNAVR
ncbi:MAG: hypothetical protein WCE30_04015 [Mycobacterium sp.]